MAEIKAGYPRAQTFFYDPGALGQENFEVAVEYCSHKKTATFVAVFI